LRPENTRGRLGHDEPLGSVKRVNLQQRIDRWVSQGLSWLMHKLIARVLGNAAPASAPRPAESKSAIPLHRDPWCGTYVSPEISFPLEQAGQVLHFCSAECRARYQRSSQRAATA
jgi:YHS domain-containing protein